MIKVLPLIISSLILFSPGLRAQAGSFDTLLSNAKTTDTVPSAGEPVVPIPPVQRDPAQCGSDFAQTKEECDARDLWGPGKLTPSLGLDKQARFKIIFHSITGFGTAGEDYHQSWTYKLLAEPALLKNNPRISASLISEEKHDTFSGTIGYILEVPKENLAGTSSYDLGTSNSNYEGLVFMSTLKEWDILPPKSLLAQTPFRGYNEMVIIGTHPSSKTSVKVVGAIIDCPTGKIIKLNNFSTDEFYKYTAKCDLKRRGLEYAVPLLDKLREQIPVYAYSVYYFK